jgi:hypothetical protein
MLVLAELRTEGLPRLASPPEMRGPQMQSKRASPVSFKIARVGIPASWKLLRRSPKTAVLRDLICLATTYATRGDTKAPCSNHACPPCLCESSFAKRLWSERASESAPVVL